MAITQTYPTNKYKYNSVYGSLVYSFYADTAPQVEIVLTSFDDDVTPNSNTLLQTPNTVGYTHFEVSSIARNKLKYYKDLESISSCFNHMYNEQNILVLSYGEPGGTQTNSAFTYYIIPARKKFYELDFDITPYEIQGSWQGSENNRANFVKTNTISAFTDFPYLERNITRDEDYTLTFLPNKPSQAQISDIGLDIPLTDFWFRLYDENDTLLDQFFIQNIYSNGGSMPSYPTNSGDHAAVGPFYTPIGDYVGIVSIAAGKSNTTLQNELNANPTTKYYTVAAAYGAVPNENGLPTPNPVALSEEYKFVIDGECDNRDYSHIQVSWVNSLGFRDYFTFTKKHEERVNIKRKVFDRQVGSWGLEIYNIDPQERGKTQYNSEAQQTYSLQTRFLEDLENEYLKNLLLSPDVKIKFEGDDNWYPVILLTNNWIEKTFRKDKFYQLEIQVEMANKIITQNNQ